ncbi:MAG: hypothetical protein KBS73_00080, partial [Bacteroidales bacterium]|nr:hypothetical protein [Candidatus Cacconaster equifaecalis]
MQKFEWAFFVIGSDWFDIAAKDRLSRRQQVICEANDADVVRPHQRSGGDRVFASGKYGKVGSRGAWGRAP